MEYITKKHTNKGSKDGSKGQGLSLLLLILSSVFSCLFARHFNDDKEVGTTLDLCYRPYYPCLYAFWYSIPTFLSRNDLVTLYCDSRTVNSE